MLEVEARWIADVLAALPDDAFPILDVGSSTAEFREQEQPFIETLVFEPLRRRGCTVVHADVKQQPGVDVALDFTDPDDRRRLAEISARTVLCSNLLEHLTISPAEAARQLVELCPSGGHLVVTVPKRFGYHADPIDNGFRPSADELAALFHGCRIVAKEDVKGPILAVHHALRRGWLYYLMQVAVPFYKPRTWAGKIAWFWRPAEIACVVVHKP